MASYFRNMFGMSGPSSTGLSLEPKTHKRSASAPSSMSARTTQNPNLSYIYAAPAMTPSSSTSTIPERSSRSSDGHHAVRATTPSPLRYATYNSGSVRSIGPESVRSVKGVTHPYQNAQAQRPARIPMYRTPSNSPGDQRPFVQPSTKDSISSSNFYFPQ